MTETKLLGLLVVIVFVCWFVFALSHLANPDSKDTAIVSYRVHVFLNFLFVCLFHPPGNFMLNNHFPF